MLTVSWNWINLWKFSYTPLPHLIPFIIVGLGLMYYNYIRFDSPFDFGANYNLTTNDMTLRGFNIDRIFLGIYYMLFKR